MHRRYLLLGAGALGLAFAPLAQAADRPANPAEDFVSQNIQAGFDILNDRNVAPADRRQRFADLLLGLTDVRRVALFLIGGYADVPQADLDAYVAAYQGYVLSIYQTYFERYSGESLKVISSRERAPGDSIVITSLTGSTPQEVDFRVRTDGSKPVLVDIAVAGAWLALAERDQFQATLAQNKGDLKALTAQLRALH